MASPASSGAPQRAGRYEIFDEIAAGGMGVVHLGRLVGEGGFSRLVAIKRLHADLALDAELVRMLDEEARLAARIRHPNVAATLDLIEQDGECSLVMEYLEGDTLQRLARASLERGQYVPTGILVSILTGALLGLHAAHEARSEKGALLNLVHRDFSPHNILVGSDGLARVLDFGIAKAASRTSVTARGAARGKLTYMSPEQVSGGPIDRRTDLFCASIVLWELLTGQRLFAADDPSSTLAAILSKPIVAPSTLAPGLTRALDRVVLRGLERDPDRRHATADEMAAELEAAYPPATQRQVAAWVMALSGPAIGRWRVRCAEVEALPLITSLPPEPSPAPARHVPPIISVDPPPSEPSPSPPRSSPVPSWPRSPTPPPAAPTSPARKLLLVGVLAAATGSVALLRTSRPELPAAPPSAAALAPSAPAASAPASVSASSSSARPRSSGPAERAQKKSQKPPRSK